MADKNDKKIISDEEIKMRIAEYRLFDDIFLSAYFRENIPGVEFVLRIILGIEDLIVTKVTVQNEYKNIRGRGVRLDVTAKDSKGTAYDIEVQRDDGGAIPKRARYHSAMLDSNELKQGQYFDELPETYVIFITENDIFKKNLSLYKIDRYIEAQDGEKILFGDDAHIIYVNGEIKDETKLGRLMHDFFCKNADDMYYSELAERMRTLKEEERSNAIMASAMEELINEAADRKGRQVAITMLEDGLNIDKVVLYSGLTYEEIEKLKKTIPQDKND